MQLELSNVVNISVAEAPVGIGEYNTSNIALFTDDAAGVDFPDDGFAIYKSPTQVAVDFGTSSDTFKMANAIFSQAPNILANGGYLVIILLEPSETLGAAITRTTGLVQYFGVMANTIQSDADTLAAAAIIQALNKVAFFVSRLTTAVDPGGILDELRTGTLTQSRGLYYGSDNDTDALVMMASYAGRGLSTNFSGSNTTQTMHLKDLSGVQPDPSMTQSILNKCQLAGADVYISLAGVSKVFCSGANKFFDQVYNLRWFVGALQVAVFNYLAQSSTKIPQTEAGMDGLKGAIRDVCEQAVTCQYSAPGRWTSSVTFGNQADLLANISQRGYYIYSSPIATQSAADRAARKAPLSQVALKEAGAIHEADVIVNINA